MMGMTEKKNVKERKEMEFWAGKTCREREFGRS